MRHINTNIFYNKPLLLKSPLNNINMNDANILMGLDVGIPLNIFSNIFTNLHYGFDITTPRSIFIQFLLGYYTYGKDRYSDSLEYMIEPYETRKKNLYNFIYDNRDKYSITLTLSYIGMLYILLTNSDSIQDLYYNLPFIPLFYFNGEYKSFKKYLREYKALYIGIMWTIATVILPCVLYDHNYDIITYPLDYLPCILTLFATSNFADIKDIDEDRQNNITTIPVKYGKNISNTISFIALVISSIVLIENPHFDNRLIINGCVELQNFGLMATLYNNTFL
tara:strand:+ start:365 stop:1204 length:840 start_codon:yes stop_codon:yes gene_type:complete